MANKNKQQQGKTEVKIPLQANTGVIVLVLDKKTHAMQHSLMSMSIEDALQATRAFTAYLENILINAVKEANKRAEKEVKDEQVPKDVLATK